MKPSNRHKPPIPAQLGLLIAAAMLLAACAERSRLPDQADAGTLPRLTEPNQTLLPTVNIARASAWPDGTTPMATHGTKVRAFASGLDHPRWLCVLPNGDVLVAETNALPRPDDAKGIKGWFMRIVMARAGAGSPSANRITLLRDADGDGQAETRSLFLQGLNSPFGMALVGNRFYVANTDAVLEYSYDEDQTVLRGAGRRLTELPSGSINHHWTKSLIASPDGSKLYVTVGSNSNAAENGIAAEEGRAAIWEIDRTTGAKRLYATGLRNPNGMAWLPDSSAPPSSKSAFAFGSHVAALGLAASSGSPLAAVLVNAASSATRTQAAQGVFVGLHGSWNRRPHSGYKVVFISFVVGKPQGLPVDVLTGFLGPAGEARGRPVGVAMDRQGALLVADDVGNTVWRVSLQ